MLGEDSGTARTIITQEMVMETAVSVTEGDSRSDVDYYDEKSTLRNSSRRSTLYITIANSLDKAKSKEKTEGFAVFQTSKKRARANLK